MFQNWLVLSYVVDYEFGGFASIRLTVINNIIYLKTHITSGWRVVCLFKTIIFKVPLFNIPQKIISLLSCVSNFTFLGFLVGTMTQNFSTHNLI